MSYLGPGYSKRPSSPGRRVHHTKLKLIDKTRLRGGKRSKRRVARVWEKA